MTPPDRDTGGIPSDNEKQHGYGWTIEECGFDVPAKAVDAFGVPTVQPIESGKLISVCRWWRHKWAATNNIYRDNEWRVNMQKYQCMICGAAKYKPCS